MLPRFSSLKCLAAGASRFVATRKTTPASNLLLHTSAANEKSGCSPCKSPADGWIPQPGYTASCDVPEIRKRKKVAVVLCGCGYFDGSDPLEVIPVCVQLNRLRYNPVFFAPDKKFCSKWKYLKVPGEEATQGEEYNMRVEAARVPGRPINDLSELAINVNEYEGLIIPGGQGVLRNLSAIMDRVPDRQWLPNRSNVPRMNADLSNALQMFSSLRKPIGCISYAGLLIAQEFSGVQITLGMNYHRPNNATGTRNDPHELGMVTWNSAFFFVAGFQAIHVNREDHGVTYCPTYHVYSTPGSLALNMSYHDTHEGIGQLVRRMFDRW